MRALEDYLSPLTQERTYNYSSLLKNDKKLINREREFISNIRSLKRKVINREISPCDIENIVKKEVVESWLRSSENGIDSRSPATGRVLDKRTFEKKKSENKKILDIVDPYISYLRDSLLCINCSIIYTDDNAVIYRLFENSINRMYKDPLMSIGTVWDEESVGTCSHALSLLYKKPFQLSGPEHYCCYDDRVIASSAPIFDANLNLKGSLTVASVDSHFQNQSALALVMPIAWGIQNRLVIEDKVSALNYGPADCVDGIISINKNGMITKASIVAEKIFHDLSKPLPGYRIESLFSDCSAIRSVLETGRPVEQVSVDVVLGNFRLRIQSIKPIVSGSGTVLGCTLLIKKCTTGSRVSQAVNSHSNDTKFSFANLIGKSPRMMKVVERAKKFASLNANILIEGESGTGKEVFAQSIHNESRPEGPFVAVNCAAIPQNLIESELFGYKGGAFTGAEKSGRIGKIELAEGGTLFLDEIGDMPLALQPVLLRALEEKKIMRVGDNRYTPVNFNLIAATNKDLKKLVKDKLFREDLYYRLAVLKVAIPPLRDRGPDIVRLARFFINKLGHHDYQKHFRLSTDVVSFLLKYNWPGNVRQLENTMFYSVNMSDNGLITCDSLPDEIGIEHVGDEFEGGGELFESQTDDGGMTMKDLEKLTIIQTLKETGNSVSKASGILGVCKSTLYRKIKKYNIAVEE